MDVNVVLALLIFGHNEGSTIDLGNELSTCHGAARRIRYYKINPVKAIKHHAKEEDMRTQTSLTL